MKISIIKKTGRYGVLFLTIILLQGCAKAQTKSNSTTPVTPPVTPTAYTKLVWQDEFDNPGLPDPAKWNYDTGFIANHELQYYTYRRAENAVNSGGMLDIVARNDSFISNGHMHAISSARLKTEGLKDWTYGRIEVRAKIPSSLGTWPAIWTLGSNISTVGWPDCGELDIMEHVGFMPDTLHFNEHAHSSDAGTRIYYNAPDQDFHIYSLEWYPDRIDWFFDGKKVFTYLNNGTNVWPYNKPQFIILNLAFGGDWGGSHGVAIDSLPRHFYIDYVRVYQ